MHRIHEDWFDDVSFDESNDDGDDEENDDHHHHRDHHLHQDHHHHRYYHHCSLLVWAFERFESVDIDLFFTQTLTTHRETTTNLIRFDFVPRKGVPIVAIEFKARIQKE